MRRFYDVIVFVSLFSSSEIVRAQFLLNWVRPSTFKMQLVVFWYFMPHNSIIDLTTCNFYERITKIGWAIDLYLQKSIYSECEKASNLPELYQRASVTDLIWNYGCHYFWPFPIGGCPPCCQLILFLCLKYFKKCLNHPSFLQIRIWFVLNGSRFLYKRDE